MYFTTNTVNEHQRYCTKFNSSIKESNSKDTKCISLVTVTKPSNKSSLKINYYEHCDLFV